MEGFGCALERMASLVVGARDEAELAERAVELCVEISGLRWGALVVAGHTERPEVLYNHGVPDPYLSFLRQQYMNLPGARIIATGQPHVVPDVRVEPGYEPFLDVYEDAGIRGMVLLPVRQAVGGSGVHTVAPQASAPAELFGVLGLYHDVPVDVSDEALALATVVAEEAALALCNFRLYRDREHYKREAVLERSQEVVGTLTAGIAHDLNNVLGTVLGVMELLPRLDPPQQHALLEQLYSQVQHATGLTRSLLELARVSRSKGDESCEPTVIAREAVEMVRASAHPETEFMVDDDGPCRVAMPSMSLLRILLNLLLNSIQAIGPRAGGRIVVSSRVAGERCAITVDDNGPGIQPEHAERVFEAFSSFEKPSGTGIGLTSARGLAERAGGTLTLRNRPGPGACLVLEVGLAREGPEAAGTRRRDVNGDAPSTRTSKGLVLLAEDEPIQRRVFADALRGAGYDVTEVATGTAAAERIASDDEYALLILDQRMPGLTGFEVLEHARRAGRQTPALMVSGFNIDPDRLLGMGRVSMVSKPLSGGDLVRHVDRWLDRVTE